jgi:hypothetical protein
LQDSGVTLEEGIKIWGAPWHIDRGIFYRASAFGISDEETQRKWDLIPEDTNILITHVPPSTIMDINHKGKSMGNPHLLLTTINRVKPNLHCFGHNHGKLDIYWRFIRDSIASVEDLQYEMTDFIIEGYGAMQVKHSDSKGIHFVIKF